MRIVVITQYYHPESMRVTDLCETLAQRGFDVVVVTGIPNYPQGKFFPGYNWFRKRQEVVNNVRIIRLPIIPRGHNFFLLSLNYISFVISGWFFTHFTHLEADIVINYEISPITQCLLGIWFGKRRKIPVVSYILDLWPESFKEITKIESKLIEGFLNKIVDKVYNNSDLILTSSRSYIQSISKRGIDKDKIKFWPQYAEDFYFLKDGPKERLLPNDGRLFITFTGNIGVAQGLDLLVPVSTELKSRGIPICFVLIGDGREKARLQELAIHEDLTDYFLFVEKQPAERIPEYLASSDASLLILKKSIIFSMTLPAKLQTYMACGLPIIASVDGEAKELVMQTKTGYVAATEDVPGLVNIITAFKNLSPDERKAMGLSGNAYAKRYFEKDRLMHELEDSMQKLIGE